MSAGLDEPSGSLPASDPGRRAGADDVRAPRIVDEAVPAVDEDPTVKQTLALLRERFPS
jgi:hypothetical protein